MVRRAPVLAPRGNAGIVNAYAIDVFARRGYLRMRTCGYPEAPARSMLGQRSLELGTVLVVNQHTLSDGEDFTEGYRALELGQVVGGGSPGAAQTLNASNTCARKYSGSPRLTFMGADTTKRSRATKRSEAMKVTAPTGMTQAASAP